MRFSLLLLAALLALAIGTGASPDPARAPALPTEPPPAMAPLGTPGPGPAEELAIPAGWSMVSFSLATVDSLSGLARTPLCYSEGAFHPVSSLPLDPGLGYLVYADAPSTVRATGSAREGQVVASWLRAGWNLVGCPSPRPLPLRRLALQRPGGVVEVLENAADPSPQPGAAWLYASATASYQGRALQLDLRDPEALLRPGQVTWLFAWHDARLLWNADLSKAAPRIASLSAPRLAHGRTLEIRGEGFGPSGTGQVTLGGLPVHPEDMVSWTPGSIRLKVPAAATAGPVVVFSQGCPSNRAALQVEAAPAPETGELSGLVLTAAGSPLPGAQVMTDDGHKAVTGPEGVFDLPRLPAGPHQVYVSRVDYKPGQGEVHIDRGATRRLQVVLSPKKASGAAPAPAIPAHAPEAAPESPERLTEMHIMAYPFTHADMRYWVRSIEVNEYGDFRRRWSNDWDTDQGDASFELDCPGAPLGRSYDIRIVWRNKLGDEKEDFWQPELQSPHGTFHYYHPD